MSIKLVAADPHPLSLLGLEQLLKDEAGIELVATCNSATQLLQDVVNHKPSGSEWS